MVPGVEIDTVVSNREKILQTLIDHPQSKASMETSLDYSRSTINRAIRELERHELVHYTDGIWKATTLGEIALQARKNYLNTVDTLAENKSLIQDISPGGYVDEALLKDATVHTATASTPDLVMNTFLQYARDASVLHLATPTLFVGFLGELYEQAISGSGSEFCLTVSEAVIEQLQETNYGPVKKIRNNDHVTLRSTDIPFSFGIWKADTSHCGVIVFTEHGIRGIIVNDTPRALAWAEARYDAVQNQ